MEAIRLMYFFANYSRTELEGYFGATSAPSHLRSKYDAECSTNGRRGTQALFTCFYEMSRDNQLAVVAYVNENYKGIN